MPISEDEFDYNVSQEPQSTMSKSELRKTIKPIMEKRRRARINQCLEEIKTLILEATNKDPARHSKLEKADILEMAVKFLQNVHQKQLVIDMASDRSVLRKFKNGFNECAAEIDKYMSQSDGADTSIRQRVTNHLQKCIGGIQQVAQFNFPGFSNMPFLSGNNFFPSNQTQMEASSSAGDLNNNPGIQIPQGIQLIPSRLPSGELALLVPNSSNLPYFPTAVNQNVQQRPSAFAAVIPKAATSETVVTKPLSPPPSPENTEEIRMRNTSPHGFRPVVPSKQRNFADDHQVPQISSTVCAMYTHYNKEKRCESPKQTVEPLRIITNQNERFKQAQMKEDSANYEENIVQRGVKRKLQELTAQKSLLTVAQNEFHHHHSKIINFPNPVETRVRESEPSSSSNINIPPPRQAFNTDFHKDVKKVEEMPSCSKDNPEGNSDMWRPW